MKLYSHNENTRLHTEACGARSPLSLWTLNRITSQALDSKSPIQSVKWASQRPGADDVSPGDYRLIIRPCPVESSRLLCLS